MSTVQDSDTILRDYFIYFIVFYSTFVFLNLPIFQVDFAEQELSQFIKSAYHKVW